MKPVIAKEVKEEILAKIKSGESAFSLAKSYGVSAKTINKVGWLEFAKLKKENQQLKEIIGVLSL